MTKTNEDMILMGLPADSIHADEAEMLQTAERRRKVALLLEASRKILLMMIEVSFYGPCAMEMSQLETYRRELFKETRSVEDILHVARKIKVEVQGL
jgi:hypothetical protein